MAIMATTINNSIKVNFPLNATDLFVNFFKIVVLVKFMGFLNNI